MRNLKFIARGIFLANIILPLLFNNIAADGVVATTAAITIMTDSERARMFTADNKLVITPFFNYLLSGFANCINKICKFQFLYSLCKCIVFT
jgi:hypothetical protein